MSISQIVKFDHIDLKLSDKNVILSYKTLMQYYLFAENTIY